MSPSTTPPFCSLTWTARTVPLTRAEQEIRGAQLAFDSAEDLSCTIAFDVTNDRHAGADARARSRFRHRRARRALFNNRMLLQHTPDDFGRICCRVRFPLGCLAFEEHVYLRFRWHALQKRPKALVSRPVQAG